MFDQRYLDVIEKGRSNYFNWRGQFTPEFVEYIISKFYEPNLRVIDPFVGSGTVLLEAGRKNLECFGFEINPAAYFMSSFYQLINLNYSEKTSLIEQCGELISKIIPSYEQNPIKTNSDNNSYRESYKHFLLFSEHLLSEAPSFLTKVLLVNILFKTESYTKLNILEATRKVYKSIRSYVFTLPYSDKKISTFLADARSISNKVQNKYNLVITSPPYINVFNYHQNHRALMEKLNYNLLSIANSEIGANRKFRGNRFKTAIQYCLDIESSIIEFSKHLEIDGIIVMIVGRESNIRGIPFYNGRIVHQLFQKYDEIEILNSLERSFDNKFGNNIVEEIIIVKKKKELQPKKIAKEIALLHLEEKLKLSLKEEIRLDVIDAINNVECITESPLFQTQ